MKFPFSAGIALILGLLALTARASSSTPEVVPLGQNTFSLTREANNGFVRGTDKLKAQALEDAAAYCTQHHKELKVISTETYHPTVPLTGFANAKVVFKALDADDPELQGSPAAAAQPGYVAPRAASVEPTAPRSTTDALYHDLTKLDELRKKGILTEDEFQAQKKKLLEKAN